MQCGFRLCQCGEAQKCCSIQAMLEFTRPSKAVDNGSNILFDQSASLSAGATCCKAMAPLHSDRWLRASPADHPGIRGIKPLCLHRGELEDRAMNGLRVLRRSRNDMRSGSLRLSKIFNSISC